MIQAENNKGTEAAGWNAKSRIAVNKALSQGKAYKPGLPEAMMLKARYEWLQNKKNIARKWWNRSLKMAEDLAIPYEKGRILLEMGKRLKERQFIEQAISEFSEINAEWELAGAKEAIELYIHVLP